MNPPAKLVLRNPAEGRTIGILGDAYRFLITGEESGGQYTILEALVPPGGGPPPHLHHNENETFYVIEGEVTFQIGDDRTTVGAGTFVNLPIGQPHAFKNESERNVRMIMTLSPAGFEHFFTEVGVEFEGELPPPPSEEEIQRLVAAAPKYGIEFVGP